MTCSDPFGKFFGKIFFFVKHFIFWEGVTPLPSPPLQRPLEACGRSGRGRSHPPKQIHEKFCFRQKIPRRGHCSLTPPGGAKGGKEMGGSSPPSKKTGREAPHNYLVLYMHNATKCLKFVHRVITCLHEVAKTSILPVYSSPTYKRPLASSRCRVHGLRS